MRKMWKQVLCVVLSILLLPISSSPVRADNNEDIVETSENSETALDAFEYTVDEALKTVTLTRYIGTDSEVVLPDFYIIEGVSYHPVLDSSMVFRGNTIITSVVIGAKAGYKDNSMSYLFGECSKLTEIDLSAADTSSVTDMSYLFYKCSALTAIDLAGLDTENVTTMRGMFSYCTKLSSLSGYEDWNTSSLEVMYQMFNRVASASGAGTLECIDLSKWDLDQVTNTGWCFQLCYAKQILLPDNLSVISAGFLNHAAKMTGTSYTIPSGVKKIGYGHTIYDFATDDFVEFIVAEGNTNYKAVDGILYSADGTEMLAVPRNKTFTDGIYEIPEGVTFLGELSFSRNYNINTLVLPDSYEIRYVPVYDPECIVFEDIGNLNAGTNLSIAIYCYTGINQYQVKESNPRYSSKDGIIYSKKMTEVVAVPARYAQEIVIPEGVTTWNREAMWADFENNSQNTLANLLVNCPGVSIPATVREISDDQLAMLNLLYTKRAGTDNPFTITLAEDNKSFKLDENGNLCRSCDHDYTSIVTDPTCTEQGYTTYICKSCEFSYVDEYVEASGHKWNDEYTVDVEPTYCEEGQKSIYCEVCDVLQEGSTVTIPKIDTSVLYNPFIDVYGQDYYYKPVLWAYYNGITKGVSDTLFAPGADCTRAQIMVFLWRSAGCPDAAVESTPFVDVKTDAYYYEALLWAYENNITTGTSETTFNPDDSGRFCRWKRY